jgi:hypothetical protein
MGSRAYLNVYGEKKNIFHEMVSGEQPRQDAKRKISCSGREWNSGSSSP